VGGVSAVVGNLVREMRLRPGFEPVIVVNEWTDTRPRQVDDQWSFRVTVLGDSSLAGIAGALLKMPWRLMRLKRFLSDRGAAVVNFHYLSSDALGVALLKLLGLYRGALVISVHGTDVRPASGRLEAVARRLIFAAADRIVAVSQGLARRAALDFGLSPARISVIYNGVNHAIFNPHAAQRDCVVPTVPEPYLVSVGQYIPRKDQATLVAAFALLAGRYPDLRLCLIGADGPDREPLLRQAERLGVASRLHVLVGLKPEQVARLVARAVACVQTALAEGLPLAVLEAGATAVPLAISAIPGHDELVEPGVTGLLFAPKHVDACAAAIAQLLDDPAAARRMALAQRERTARLYTWEACVDGYFAAIGVRHPVDDGALAGIDRGAT
jgi:glycosyltransferase involved in cell wall biosynthesis